LSSSKFIPRPDEPHKKPATASGTPAPAEGVNALWRVPTWFAALPAETLAMLKTFHVELLKFNGKLNLISRNTEREADETHFADSILACQLILANTSSPRIYDFGSGNGFPGLVLAILDPKREVHLVESDMRKCEFLKHMIHLLKLSKVTLLNVRLETLTDANI
jgi:16S rRNA (guanine527-N7)-methyltransferase